MRVIRIHIKNANACKAGFRVLINTTLNNCNFYLTKKTFMI